MYQSFLDSKFFPFELSFNQPSYNANFMYIIDPFGTLPAKAWMDCMRATSSRLSPTLPPLATSPVLAALPVSIFNKYNLIYINSHIHFIVLLHHLGTSIAFHFESKDKKGQSYEISAQCYTSVFDSFIDTDDDNFYFSEMIDEFQEVESLSVPVEEETLSEAELEGLQGGDLDQPSSRQLSHRTHNNREEDDVLAKRTAGALIDKYGPLDAELDGGDQDDKDSEAERTRKVMRLKYEGRVVRGARDHGMRRSVSAKSSTRRLQQDQTEAQQQEDEEQSSTMYFLGICLNADDSLTELNKPPTSRNNNGNRKLLGVQPWIDVTTTSTTTPTTISTTVESGSWESLVTPMLMLSSILVLLLCMTVLVFAFPQKGTYCTIFHSILY